MTSPLAVNARKQTVVSETCSCYANCLNVSIFASNDPKHDRPFCYTSYNGGFFPCGAYSLMYKIVVLPTTVTRWFVYFSQASLDLSML